MKNILTVIGLFILNIFLLLAVRIPAILVGPLVVAIALPFRVESPTRYKFTQFDGMWWHVGLPRWAWLWSNDRDGLLGDKRGWWSANTPFYVSYTHPFCMWWWAAIRNPANNQRHTKLLSCDVSECNYVVYGDRVVEDDRYLGGKQAVVATNRKTGRKYLGIYIVHEYKWKRLRGRAFVFQFGFKIKPSSWEDVAKDSSRKKGFTLEITFFKNLD